MFVEPALYILSVSVPGAKSLPPGCIRRAGLETELGAPVYA
jgi:hypothetical protein